MLADPGFLEDAVSRMTVVHGNGYGECASCDGAKPNFVASFALPDQGTALRQQNGSQLRVKAAPHSRYIANASGA
jgi:hypothetical protein